MEGSLLIFDMGLAPRDEATATYQRECSIVKRKIKKTDCIRCTKVYLKTGIGEKNKLWIILMKKKNILDDSDLQLLEYQHRGGNSVRFEDLINFVCRRTVFPGYMVSGGLLADPSRVLVFLEYQDPYTKERSLIAHNRSSFGGTSPELCFAPNQTYYVEIEYLQLKVRVSVKDAETQEEEDQGLLVEIEVK